MKSKTRKLWLLAGVCFLFSGIMNLISEKYFFGITNIFLGGLYLVLSIIKGNKKTIKIEVSDTVLDNINVDLRNLIEEGKKIEAIKKYRMVTGSGLKEAKEYIDNLK
ncbi:ribosomal protein L7/L12 [Clostridium sp.]|uniref:ribosomal protein L7/L12 n=1 Tax=Clostridium sp. TaxID=1506 RepID=UPI00284F18F6|nr:ribosomal protein L7/L12 [Clostridium sp.]MDR3593194.1 ribosomal protein L7/L12 [Clostridium sp.]